MKDKFTIRSEIVPLECEVVIRSGDFDESMWIVQGTQEDSTGVISLFEKLQDAKSFVEDNLVPEDNKAYKIYVPHLTTGYNPEVKRLMDLFKLDTNYIDLDKLEIIEIPYNHHKK